MKSGYHIQAKNRYLLCGYYKTDEWGNFGHNTTTVHITDSRPQQLTRRYLSAHTATAYRTDLLQFLTWLSENDISVNHSKKITRRHILDYLSYLAGLGRTGVTRTRKLAAIREICKFLAASQLLPSSPAKNIVRPKKVRKQCVFLRINE